MICGSQQDKLWDITMGILGTEEVDIGSSQDEEMDKKKSLIGILEGDISIFRKEIIWKIS